ncbi:MAG: hypothetical protein O3C40_28090 [Planctomycetota bacterium]|nr:hypothetical protein [Planctomycetota bacterium]
MSSGDPTEEKLREIAGRSFKALEASTVVKVGFRVRARLDDFISGAFFLVQLNQKLDLGQIALAPDTDTVSKQFKPTIRRLCELSREVTFATNLRRVPKNLRTAIEELFEFTVEQIPTCSDQEIEEYKENIRHRTLQPALHVELQN